MKRVSKLVTGTGSDMNISLGFIPDRVFITNVTTRTGLEMLADGGTVKSCIAIAAAGTRAAGTTTCTIYVGDKTNPAGVTLTSAAVNVNTNVMYVVAETFVYFVVSFVFTSPSSRGRGFFIIFLKEDLPMSKLILSNGKPFKSEELAREYVNEKLNGKGDVVELGEEFAILEEVIKKTPPVKYIKCRIAPRLSTNEDAMVDLCNNGRQVKVIRGTDVILPEDLILVAEEAVMEKFELKGTVLVSLGPVSTCPITRLGSSTKEKYLAQVEEGNAIRDKEIKASNALSGG